MARCWHDMDNSTLIVVVALVVLVVLAAPAWGDTMTTFATLTPAQRAFAQAIARAEGFGVSGATPTVRHNPGDLVDTFTGQIKVFASDADGWDALARQVVGMLAGHGPYSQATTLAEIAYLYANGEGDPVGAQNWLANVTSGLRAAGYAVSADGVLAETLGA